MFPRSIIRSNAYADVAVYAGILHRPLYAHRKGKKKTAVLDAQTVFSIRLYCYGTLGMTREWLLHDNITPARTIVEMVFASMPDSLRQLYF
jgi:hypothetical protein